MSCTGTMHRSKQHSDSVGNIVRRGGDRTYREDEEFTTIDGAGLTQHKGCAGRVCVRQRGVVRRKCEALDVRCDAAVAGLNNVWCSGGESDTSEEGGELEHLWLFR